MRIVGRRGDCVDGRFRPLYARYCGDPERRWAGALRSRSWDQSRPRAASIQCNPYQNASRSFAKRRAGDPIAAPWGAQPATCAAQAGWLAARQTAVFPKLEIPWRSLRSCARGSRPTINFAGEILLPSAGQDAGSRGGVNGQPAGTTSPTHFPDLEIRSSGSKTPS